MSPEAGFQQQAGSLLGLAPGWQLLLAVAGTGLQMQSVQVSVVEPLLLLALHTQGPLSTNHHNKKTVNMISAWVLRDTPHKQMLQRLC